MASVNEATEELIKTVERNLDRLAKVHATGRSAGMVAFCIKKDLETALAPLQKAIAEYDVPNYVCPLCGQAKEQTALLELLGSMKSCEVWGDDGQSWTIDVASCDGNLEEIVGLMTAVKRGEYEGETK